ncbi:hypothetical protein HYW20_01120 [Candidatus Woesearchaeota archaeon]|nr:hypothetical protein [Candidatus Woesearchaeota archaeon]
MAKKIKAELSIKDEYLSKSDKPILPLAKWKTVKGRSKTRFLSEQVDSINYNNL